MNEDPRVEAAYRALVAETNVQQNWVGIAKVVVRAIDRADAQEGFQRTKKPVYFPGEKPNESDAA